MARKSRRKENQIVVPDLYEYEYKVGVYLRVSVIDKTEHNSIYTQGIMTKEYVERNPDWELVKVYTDNGYSSYCKDRPAFNEMIEDIYSGKINCIVVKDLSRFSRDYIECGIYLYKIFPNLKIRFISILDRYDSLNKKDDNHFELMLRNIINHSYSMDISARVKSSAKLRQSKGSYIPPYLPFGYIKGKKDEEIWLIEREAATVVKRIFELFCRGKSCYKIAVELNKSEILTPASYKASREIYKTNKDTSLWTPTMVKRILTNRVYAGDFVGGKTKRNLMQHTLENIPEPEWKLIENHHTAIIERDVFDNVQVDLLKKQDALPIPERGEFKDIFSEKLFCGECGRKMKRQNWVSKNKLKTVYYTCPGRQASNGIVCSTKSISIQKLKQAIVDKLQNDIAKAIECKENREHYESSLAYKLWCAAQQDELNTLTEILKALQEQRQRIIVPLYMAAFDGEQYIKSDFAVAIKVSSQRIEVIKNQIDAIEQAQRNYLESESSNSKWITELLKYKVVSVSDGMLINKPIRRINIKNNDVELIYDFNI